MTISDLKAHVRACTDCLYGSVEGVGTFVVSRYCVMITEKLRDETDELAQLRERYTALLKDLSYQKSVVERMLDGRRDEFAKAALTGEIASYSTKESVAAMVEAAVKKGIPIEQHVAENAFLIADAMMRARTE